MAVLFQAIVGFFAALFGKIFSAVTDHFVKNAARTVTILAAFTALLVGLSETLSAILSGISTSIPPDLAQGLAMFKPDNFEACVSAMISAKAAVWIYQMKTKFMEWQAGR